ncbi:MAG: PhoH family protein [Phycisphaerales bacterium]
MEVIVTVPAGVDRVSVLGSGDRNLKMLREALGVNVAARGSTVRLSGSREAITAARDVLVRLHQAARSGEEVSRQQVLDMINWAASRPPGTAPLRERLSIGDSGGEHDDAREENEELSGPAWGETLDVYASGRAVRPKTANQQVYLNAIRDNDLVFGVGPAGTGKTYLAVAAAVHLLKTNRARKIILVRPAVEAGERLGFLPGDMQAKVNPYLRPLFDALGDMMDYSTMQRFMMSDVVEVVPLAFMRGRTLNRSVIILDEAQNTTRTQMKMFLTRMGHGSKMIVTGDPTQIDLPNPRESGLIDAAQILRRVKGVSFIALTQEDIVRHNLVQRIVEAYEDVNDAPRGLERQNLNPSAGSVDLKDGQSAKDGGKGV